jgi:type IV secretory pathway VirB3-like protein
VLTTIWQLWTSPPVLIGRIAVLVCWRVTIRLLIVLALIALWIFATVWAIKYLRAGNSWARVIQSETLMRWSMRRSRSLTRRFWSW